MKPLVRRARQALVAGQLRFGESALPALSAEVATRQAAGLGWLQSGFMGVLPDPDPVLESSGQTSAVLASLLKDGHVESCLETRKNKTLQRLVAPGAAWKPGAPGGGEPSPEAVRLRDEFVRQLWNLDIHEITQQMLDAPAYGLAVFELLYSSGQAGRGRPALSGIVAKPQEWFGFDDQNAPVFRGVGGVASLTGEPLDPRKFVLARHRPSYSNPYGKRLLSRCLWPVAFKHGGMAFFVQFTEKFGSPWIVGKYRPGADPAEQQAMLSRLSAMLASAVSVIPSGSEIQLLEPTRGEGPHAALIALCNAEISKVLMGQTLTAEVGDHGSYGASKTHESVLDAYAGADAQLVKTTWDNLAWAWTQAVAPGAPSPVFTWEEAPDIREAQAERDKNLHAVGVRFTPQYLMREYGLQEGDFTLSAALSGANGGAGADAPSGSAGGGNTEFAEARAFTPFTADQAEIEALVAAALPEGAAAMSGLAARIAAVVARAETLEDLLILLAEEFRDADAQELEDVLERAMLAADMWGRFSAAPGQTTPGQQDGSRG